MVAAVRIHKTGGPEVLTYEDIQLKDPGQGEVRIKHTAIGLNFIDTYFRTGLYPAPGGLPMILGNEGAGVVVSTGPGVTEFKAGDRVAYGTSAGGGYSTERNIPADKLVKLSDKVDDKSAAGMMLKGLTAQYLVRQTFKVAKGQTVLVQAAAGGVGLILCQWCKHLGATVIGTVGSEDKAKLAKANGADHTILYRSEDFAAKVGEITKGAKCDVV
jgi:NADPH2:quinone reductase